MIEFESELHDELYKLFILSSNNRDIFNNPFLDEYTLSYIICFYTFQYNDRSYCEEEFVGYVSDDFNHNLVNNLYSFGRIDNAKGDYRNNKIKFKFVDE